MDSEDGRIEEPTLQNELHGRMKSKRRNESQDRNSKVWSLFGLTLKFRNILFCPVIKFIPDATPFDCGVDRGVWNISGDVGLVSAGRIDKDTPPLTTPGHTSKSSAMDISSHIF
jgi:hypothetical protein